MFWDTAYDNVAISCIQNHDSREFIKNASALQALPLKMCNIGLQLTYWPDWKPYIPISTCLSPLLSTSFEDEFIISTPEPIPQPSSHISALPVEILHEIFQLFLQDGEDADERECGFFSINNEWIASPLVLTQVCGHWRDVALSTPTLWSSIAIASPREKDVHMAGLWLQRAGRMPLSIHITQRVEPSAEEVAITDDLIHLLATRSHSWKRVAFHFEGSTVQRSLLQLSASHHLQFPELQSLSLQMDTWADLDAFEARDVVWQMFASCSPALNELVLDDCMDIPSCIPWHQLSHLQITFDLSIGEFFGLLQVASQLQTLKVWKIVSTEGIECSPKLLVPHLQSLDVTSEVDMKDAFDGLTMPSLTHLSLNFHSYCGIRQRPIALNDFLARSDCQLRSFSLRHIGEEVKTGEEELVQMLSSPRLGKVASLALRLPVFDKTVRLLTLPSDSLDAAAVVDEPSRFPFLRDLSLTMCCSALSSIIQLVDSRSVDHRHQHPHYHARPRSSSLKALNIGFRQRLSDDTQLLEFGTVMKKTSKVAITVVGGSLNVM